MVLNDEQSIIMRINTGNVRTKCCVGSPRVMRPFRDAVCSFLSSRGHPRALHRVPLSLVSTRFFENPDLRRPLVPQHSRKRRKRIIFERNLLLLFRRDKNCTTRGRSVRLFNCARERMAAGKHAGRRNARRLLPQSSFVLNVLFH